MNFDRLRFMVLSSGLLNGQDNSPPGGEGGGTVGNNKGQPTAVSPDS